MKPIEAIKQRIKRNRYGKMFLEQYGFKTMTLSVCSAAINLGFAIANLVSAIWYRSAWYGSLAGYYAALILFRVAVVVSDTKGRKKYADDEQGYAVLQNKIELAGGAFLVIVEIAMGAAITVAVLFGRPVKTGRIMAISTAAYAFYKITMAIVNMVKAKNHGNPVVQSLRNLNLADACMTMVSLTVMMLTTFGEEEAEGTFMLTMEAAVGFAACAVVLVLATVMIVRSVKRINKEKDNGL